MASVDVATTKDDTWVMISQGAEARIWKIPIPSGEGPSHMIAKERFSRSYRHPDLDNRLTKQRCRFETRLLEKCFKAGIRVPRVIKVEATTMFLECLTGPTVRVAIESALDANTEESKLLLEQLSSSMGEMVAQLHHRGVVHGDLTTSNFVLHENEIEQHVYLIDFGLAVSTVSAEARAVDLVVWDRAVEATHPRLTGTSFADTFHKKYADCAPDANATVTRLQQVRLRGRKREQFG